VSRYWQLPLTSVTETITSSPSRSRRDLSRGYFRKWNGGGPRKRGHTPCIRAVLGIDRPARDRTARCWLHWCRRGSSRLDPVIPGSAARNRVGGQAPRRMTAVERRKASAPPLQLRANAERGANVARAAYAGRLCFLRRGGNQWCACRRSASLLLREARRAFLKREAKLGCEGASRERGTHASLRGGPPGRRSNPGPLALRQPPWIASLRSQ
jgi:hypothetical protein